MLRCARRAGPREEISLHTEAAGFAPPDAFGPFRVLHQIGAGALGPVFRAYDPEQARLVAVKLFRIDVPPERVHQLVAELEFLIGADLSHPGLAAPIATGIAGAAAYLAQDFVAADSLDTVVREHGPAPPVEALRVVSQIAGALDSAAPAGIFHGALHPRDVLISTDDARVTGLGVAQTLARIGLAAPVRRPYTAPERSAARWDQRADVFSLAALTYELLWGKRIAATGGEAADAITPLGGVDAAALRDVFACALADDPSDRFETAGKFVTELEAAMMGVSAPDPGLPTPDSRLPTTVLLPLESSAEDILTAVPAESSAPSEDADFRFDLSNLPPPEEPAPEPPMSPSLLIPPARVGAPVDDDTARSGVWPIVLALFVGVALGFSGGYWLGNTQRDASLEATVATAGTDTGTSPMQAAATASETEVQLSPDTGSVRLPPSREASLPSTALKPAKSDTPGETIGETAETIAPATPARPAGRITVRSTPAGARVAIDGRDVGKTPVTARELGRGAHTVRVSRDGYRTQERRVSVTAAQPNRIVTVQLPRAAGRASAPVPSPAAPAAKQTASLVVESRPNGATVLVDGKRIGTTPMSIGEIVIGAHAVRLELDGYQPWTASVRIVAGEKNRVAASLER